MGDDERLDQIEKLWRIYQPTGDPEAYGRLYKLNAGWLMGYLEKRDHGRRCAEFAHSEAWLRVWTRRSGLPANNGRAFPAWLIRIATNELNGCFRKKANQSTSLDSTYSKSDPGSPEPWQNLIGEEESRALEECIDKHGGEYVEMERLKIAGKSAKQIAEELNLESADAVSRRKYAIKEQTIARIKACVEEKLP